MRKTKLFKKVAIAILPTKSSHFQDWGLLECTYRSCCCWWAPPPRGPPGSWRCPASGWCQRDTGTCSGKRTRLHSGSLRREWQMIDGKWTSQPSKVLYIGLSLTKPHTHSNTDKVAAALQGTAWPHWEWIRGRCLRHVDSLNCQAFHNQFVANSTNWATKKDQRKLFYHL